mgnify:CR=1 FL=1
MIGNVVFSKAGRDKGKFMVVVGLSDGNLLVADGKERPLDRPKLKNPKHLQKTNSILEEKQYSTNKSLRKALNAFVKQQEED